MTKLITILCLAISLTACASHQVPKTAPQETSDNANTDQPTKKPMTVWNAPFRILGAVLGGFADGVKNGRPTYRCTQVMENQYNCDRQ